MTETQFKMIYASGQQFGKAMAQALELAERARGFTAIEITVVPHPDLDAKDKRISALESELGDCRLALRDNNAAWAGRELNFELAKIERNAAEVRAKALEAENAKLRAVVGAAKKASVIIDTYYYTDACSSDDNDLWFARNNIDIALRELEATI